MQRFCTLVLVSLAALGIGCGNAAKPPPAARRAAAARSAASRPATRPATVLVAAVQCYSRFGDPAGNRKTLARLVRRAASRGAKIVVLPETAVTGYLSADLKRTWQTGGRATSEGLTGVDPKDAAETVPE